MGEEPATESDDLSWMSGTQVVKGQTQFSSLDPCVGTILHSTSLKWIHSDTLV